MIKVSIIVPAYNMEKYLSQCIESLINQTYKNLEIILIDDKSIDNTKKIMQKYKKKDARIKCFYNQNNLGANITRTIGIQKSSGEYLMFVDADDYILPNTVNKLIHNIIDNKADLIKFNFINRKKISLKKNFYYENDKIELYKILLTNNELNNLANEIVNKKLLDTTKDIFNIKSSIGEDLLINLEIFDKAKKIEIIPNEYYFYRKNMNSTTNTEDITKIYNIIEEIKYIYNYLCNYAKKWNMFSSDYEKKILLRESKATITQIIRILNLKNFSEHDYLKIKDIIDNNEILKKLNKKDIKEVETNIFNKIIFLYIINKKFKMARFLLKVKKIIKKFLRRNEVN